MEELLRSEKPRILGEGKARGILEQRTISSFSVIFPGQVVSVVCV